MVYTHHFDDDDESTMIARARSVIFTWFLRRANYSHIEEGVVRRRGLHSPRRTVVPGGDHDVQRRNTTVRFGQEQQVEVEFFCTGLLSKQSRIDAPMFTTLMPVSPDKDASRWPRGRLWHSARFHRWSFASRARHRVAPPGRRQGRSCCGI